jgi:hypothetical protein
MFSLQGFAACLQERSGRGKIPSTKSQIPNKFKKSNPKTQTILNLSFWILFFVWNLVLGIWNFK